MSPVSPHPRDATGLPQSRHNSTLYALFLLQALVSLAFGLFGNAAVERIRIEPAMLYLWNILALVIVAMVGLLLLQSEAASRASLRLSHASSTRPDSGGWFATLLGRPTVAFPLSFLLGTLLTALVLLVVPRGEIPFGLLWYYEAALFVVSLGPLGLVAGRERNLTTLLPVWLGLALGISSGILLLRPEDNSPLFTPFGWMVSVGITGWVLRTRLLQGLVGDFGATIRELTGRR